MQERSFEGAVLARHQLQAQALLGQIGSFPVKGLPAPPVPAFRCLPWTSFDLMLFLWSWTYHAGDPSTDLALCPCPCPDPWNGLWNDLWIGLWIGLGNGFGIGAWIDP